MAWCWWYWDACWVMTASPLNDEKIQYTCIFRHPPDQSWQCRGGGMRADTAGYEHSHGMHWPPYRASFLRQYPWASSFAMLSWRSSQCHMPVQHTHQRCWQFFWPLPMDILPCAYFSYNADNMLQISRFSTFHHITNPPDHTMMTGRQEDPSLMVDHPHTLAWVTHHSLPSLCAAWFFITAICWW